MEGYDFVIDGNDVPDYRCPICLLLLRNAMVLPCSHSSCKDCLLVWEQQANSEYVLINVTCKCEVIML